VTAGDRIPPDGLTYDRIRRDLLGGVYGPGQRLPIAALCEHYGAGLSVAREALTRLAEQGLIRAERNRGFAAIPLSVDELEDLMLARVQIEEACLRRSMVRGDTRWEASVVAAHHALTKAPSVDPAADPAGFAEWTEAHAAFHAALCAASASPRLLELRQSLFDTAEIYRTWLRPPGGLRDRAAEHREIMDAVLVRDSAKACALMTVHITRTSDQLTGTARDGPGAYRPVDRDKADRDKGA
jgi:DNA-binding GntR family transcriptional regulator